MKIAAALLDRKLYPKILLTLLEFPGFYKHCDNLFGESESTSGD